MSNILLTSFTTWLPHQPSNSSDDLLAELSEFEQTLPLTFLRRLPVDIERASRILIDKIQEVNPNIIICCGMAECRTVLSIESNACDGNTVLKTNVDLDKLLEGNTIQISHDAGKFVCEGLYYNVLKYISDKQLNIKCIFVHVPVLSENNRDTIREDFKLILKNIF